jgi:transposase-like protein
MFPVSYHDLELTLVDRGVEVAHTILFREAQTYARRLRSGSGPFKNKSLRCHSVRGAVRRETGKE